MKGFGDKNQSKIIKNKQKVNIDQLVKKAFDFQAQGRKLEAAKYYQYLIQQGIKDYSDWPTIPQLYVQGEFTGGCDIVKELFDNGELKKLLEAKKLI